MSGLARQYQKEAEEMSANRERLKQPEPEPRRSRSLALARGKATTVAWGYLSFCQPGKESTAWQALLPLDALCPFPICRV